MKNRITIVFAVMMVIPSLYAQEFKLARSTGKLVIKEVNHVIIEGTSGSEIIFSSLDGSREKDKRADGLRAVSNNGLEDNTGIGLAVQDKGTTYEVYQLKKMDGPHIKILVPRGVSIYYSHASPHGSDVKLKNIESEVEVSTVHNGVHLENVTGPLNIKTVHGEIEADFNSNIKGPLSLTSTHGLVDITIPLATRATLSMSTSYGEIFVDPALKLEIEPKSEFVRYGANKINGKINGGGIDITLSSSHNNVYLRKK